MTNEKHLINDVKTKPPSKHNSKHNSKAKGSMQLYFLYSAWENIILADSVVVVFAHAHVVLIL